MTPQEDEALNVFICMVAELNDMQKLIDSLMNADHIRDKRMGSWLSEWVDTLRAGHSQEYLNELVLAIIDQEDPQHA